MQVSSCVEANPQRNVTVITSDVLNNHTPATLAITGIASKFDDIRIIEFPTRCMSPISLLPSAISELFAQVSSTGKITLADRYGIMAAILEGSADEEEMHCLNRLLYALQRGKIEVVDDLSAVA